MASSRPIAAVLAFGPFRFEPGNGLWRDGAEVPLPPRALGLLEALTAQPGSVVSKQSLRDAVWKDAFVTEASLLEAIRVVREALGDDRLNPRYIRTVHRRGYRFVAPVSSVTSAPEAPEAPAAPEAPDAHAWRPLLVAGAAATAAMIGIAIVFALFGQRPPEPRPTMRFTIALPDDLAIDPLRGSVAVSADGTRMVYVAIVGGRPRLLLRTIDRDTPQIIDGSDGAADPFFSPDGRWIGFFARGTLKKLSVDGGTPVVLCAARAGAGASWGRDGTIVFGGGAGGGLSRVSQDGGDPVSLTAPPAGSRDVTYGWPDVLPDGAGVIYTAVSLSSSRVAVYDIARASSTALIESGAFGRYAPTGYLVFERRGRLEAAAFDAHDRRLMNAPKPILRGLATGGPTPTGPRFAFSRTGSLIYVPAVSADVDEQLQWLDVRGQVEPIPLPPAPIGAVDVAPDLQQLAMTVETEAGDDLWVGDLRRGAVSRLISDGRSAGPTWRPDGLEIAFAYSKAGPFNIFTRSTDGGSPEPLLASPWNQLPTSWSPDGRHLAFTEFHPMTGADIWVLDLATRERRPIVRTLFDESHARFSPDGKWLAYASNESGRMETYVQPYPSLQGRAQISTEGGVEPVWARTGSRLFYRGSGKFMAVDVDMKDGIRASPPKVVMDDTYENTQGDRHTAYDVTPDGRFLMIGKRASAPGSLNYLQIIYAGR
jgi:serine/threonine-protein kinase